MITPSKFSLRNVGTTAEMELTVTEDGEHLLRMEASALLLQQAGDDAALYGTLRGMVAEGRATVSDHSAILCRGGQSAMMTSEAEFQYPEHNDDLIPTGWAILGSGSRLDAEAQFDRWNVALVRHEAPELVRLLRRGTAHAVALASHERSSGASRRSGICVIRGHFLPYGARLSNMSRIWPRSSSSMAR